MALFQKETTYGLLGAGIGAGVVLAIPFVGPVLAAIGRPLAKAIIARSLDGLESATEKLAGVAESFQDLVAEARAERAQRGLPTAAVNAPGGEHSSEPGGPGVN